MYSLNNNYTDLSFNPWSDDHEPSEMFMRIVREMQIEPNSILPRNSNESESGQQFYTKLQQTKNNYS